LRRFDAPLRDAVVVHDQPTAPMPLDFESRPRTAETPTRSDDAQLIFQRIASPAEPAFAALSRLVCADQAYWTQTRTAPMTEHAAAELLRFLPADAGGEQKYLWALHRGATMVGCLDVLRQWPTRSTLSIGLLMIHPAFRGQGLGQAALTQLRARTRAWSAVRRWRVAVVESQAQARAFWRGKGYAETGQRHPDPMHRAPLVIMERTA
jgi:GNAT superfamily N-acetyltransferase